MKHYSVLSKEAIDKLKINPKGVYVDATLGLGGHAKLIAEKLEGGRLIAFDQDLEALTFAKKELKNYSNIIFINDNFKNLKRQLENNNISKIDGIIYDLGTSYFQLTTESRGFTYHGEATLDMRMDQNQSLSAYEVINTYSEKELADIFWKFGDEKQARTLAKKIVEKRAIEKIKTNIQLNEIIKDVKGYSKKKHPSKNIFQAIRIEVNKELEVLETSLIDALSLLKVGGICVVISFHSLEDKIVKNIFWKNKEDIIISEMGNQHRYHTLRTVYPSTKELLENKASRSAKLRTIKRIHD